MGYRLNMDTDIDVNLEFYTNIQKVDLPWGFVIYTIGVLGSRVGGSTWVWAAVLLP